MLFTSAPEIGIFGLELDKNDSHDKNVEYSSFVRKNISSN